MATQGARPSDSRGRLGRRFGKGLSRASAVRVERLATEERGNEKWGYQMSIGNVIQVSEHALLKRLNRAMAKEGYTVRKARGPRAELDVGRFYVVNTTFNVMAGKDVDLEDLARNGMCSGTGRNWLGRLEKRSELQRHKFSGHRKAYGNDALSRWREVATCGIRLMYVTKEATNERQTRKL
jgi:hypothetical protein